MFTKQGQLGKQSIRNHRNKQKELPKMGRKRKNLQFKEMADSPQQQLNDMEARIQKI